MRFLTLPIALIFLSSVCNAAEVPKGDDKWFSMNAVGFHHHGDPKPVSMNESESKGFFSEGHPFLSENFQENILSKLLEEIAGQEFKPTKSLPLKDSRCFAEVSKFNKKEVHIKVLKPLGNWRWHHNFQCLAIYKMKRSKAIDEIFSIDKLYQKFSFVYQGIGHGMPGPVIRGNNNSIVNLLGEPTFGYPSQSPSLGRYYYEKHDLHIVTHEFIVYYVEMGKPDWVEHVNKEIESNKELKASGKSAP